MAILGNHHYQYTAFGKCDQLYLIQSRIGAGNRRGQADAMCQFG